MYIDRPSDGLFARIDLHRRPNLITGTSSPNVPGPFLDDRVDRVSHHAQRSCLSSPSPPTARPVFVHRPTSARPDCRGQTSGGDAVLGRTSASTDRHVITGHLYPCPQNPRSQKTDRLHHVVIAPAARNVRGLVVAFVRPGEFQTRVRGATTLCTHEVGPVGGLAKAGEYIPCSSVGGEIHRRE